jgi:Subtilase family/PA domain/Fibronectin type-III domain
MSERPHRRLMLSGILGIATLLASVLPTAAVQPTDLTASALSPSGRISGFKSASADLAKSDRALVARTDAARVNVVIKLDYDAVASYAGGRANMPATSPRVTGKKLTGKSSAEVKYGAFIRDQESAAIRAIQAKVPTLKVGETLRVVYGGFAASLPANTVKDVVQIKGVVAVQSDSLRQPLTDASSDFISATPLQNALGGRPNAGAGTIFGSLDTGAWPEHPSFADQGNLGAPPPKGDGTPRACDFGDNPLTPATDVFACNHKLIGGKPFLNTYLSDPGRSAGEVYHTARDSNGHGSHTASTSAGNVLASAQVLGVERGPINGIAPGAWVSAYKVCGALGCFGSDSAAAVQQAILDGVNVINFSISGGTDPFTDPVELAFLDAYAAGVFVSASAGNDGPAASTANHLSPWVMTVAASTQTREFSSTLTLHGATTGDLVLHGASITAGVSSDLPVVLSSAAPYSNNRCTAPAAAGTFTGKIVACQRGVNARVDKGYNVLQGGAAGMILYNASLADTETDNHWLPAVHLADGTQFKAFMLANASVSGSFTAGTKQNGQGDVMAAFSSRGPAGLVIKPDVTAPGVQILAGHSPTPESITEGPPGQYFQAIAGTSMSSPHVAGAGLLLKDAHPTWTPGQIKSALMTTAITSVVKENLTTPADPFDFGAGRIKVVDASAAALTFDETAVRMAALGGDPLTAINLNIPSIDAPVMPGQISTTRTAKNSSGSRVEVSVTTTAPAASTIDVSPKKVKLNPGQSATFAITITSDAPIDQQQFGAITIAVKGGKTLHLPVAFVHTQGVVTLSQSCLPTSIAVGATSTCDVAATNQSFEPETVSLKSSVGPRLKILSASGATLANKVVSKNNVLLDGAHPGTPDVAPGELFGYIPLSAFGVAPEPIGDEDILNFNVPAFVYAGATYTVLGVDSNGYVIAGGGTAEDNNCCNIPSGPDPARPNNILAMLWTDLDGSNANGIYAATLTDGVNTWLVIEYQVKVFGTSDLRTFQVWIGVDGVEDITYAYSAAQANPNGQPFLVGAENEIGQGDMTATLPTGDLRVTSTSPTPGESASYSFVVRGESTGPGLVTTTMTATGVPGTTIAKSTINVTP